MLGYEFSKIKLSNLKFRESLKKWINYLGVNIVNSNMISPFCDRRIFNHDVSVFSFIILF